VIDYLKKYVTDKGFDLPRLLHDDFFLAIKVTFNAGYYISAAKLLVSFIDTMGYLESGDGGAVAFRGWLDKHVDMRSLNITSEELWEHRNSLLHMSTLNSRKVSGGHVRRLVAYVGQLPPSWPSEDKEAKWFNLLGLIQAVAQGIGHYTQTMSQSPERRSTFIERYDHILSDSRVQRFELPGS
jgi:hypothetical protein